TVNRAEFLKMAYLAAGRTPKAIYAGCFSDVESGSWYEIYVCDAAAREHGFVQGYADKTFKPGNPVNRTEALKMTFLVLGLEVPNLTEFDKDVIKFVDISTSAWYSKYLSAGYINGILPIAGMEATRFSPEKPLTRGEAAAYLVGAMTALSKQKSMEAASSSSIAAMESGRSSSSSAAADLPIIKNVVFPFSEEGQFTKKKPIAYLFELKDAKTMMTVNVGITGFYASDVSCRLYLLDDDGFTEEYYLGMQDPKTCTLSAALRPGKYQLQIQPTVADAFYSVAAFKQAATDGNDGFMEAVPLTQNKTKTATLESNEFADWYTFTLDKAASVSVEATSSEPVTCIIYTPKEFDQFGFAGPECDAKPYQLTEGTYTIGITRKHSATKRLTYVLQWH
ncbi:MAG TPA: S-layer homology domain-containing protein, partial [Candidatus Peribacteria bacterium]|nr:S-layer homology domain-containing protein [Candidatus Peribacteria bacterium]